MNNEKITPNGEQNLRQNRKPSADLSTMVYGVTPPQALEAEEVVLGAIMLERGAFDTAAEILRKESFYASAHQMIFGACQRLVHRNRPIDYITVTEDLREAGELDAVGGPYAISRLTNSVVSGANLETHARIIQQRFLSRELIRMGGTMVVEGYKYETDPFELIDTLEGDLLQLTNRAVRGTVSGMEELIAGALGHIEQMRKQKSSLTGVPTGFPYLDSITGGWQAPDLIIIAARPSVGKTAFAINLARNAALNELRPTPVAFFSLEMSKGQITERLLSAESALWLGRIRRGQLTDEDMKVLYQKAVLRLIEAKLFVDDTAAINIFELRGKVRRLKAKYGIGLVVIDYLQLMGSVSGNRNSNREQEVSQISRDLKALAKELNIPIIALSQLSRDVEKRKGDPQLSDLRESGAIEQDADMVMFLTRPDYQKLEGQIDPVYNNDAEGKIRKHRNGPLEDLAFKTDLSIQRWFEPSQWDEYQAGLGNFKKLPTPVSAPGRDFSAPATEIDNELPF